METVNSGRALKKALLKVDGLLMDDIAIILRKLAIDAFRELVQRSPTDTGFLRSNWSVAVDTTPLVDTQKNTKKEKNSFMSAQFPNVVIKGDAMVTIYNNTEYAIYIENGTERMRAQPMIAPTSQMIELVARKLTVALSRKKYNV
jgi:HK97 gp10 family phage protein